MLFNSLRYFLFFILVLMVLDTFRRRNFQQTFLLIASYYFYWAFSSLYVFVVVGVTLYTFYFGRAIFHAGEPKKKKILLILSVGGQLAVLAYFKYTNFAIGNLKFFLGIAGVNNPFHLLDIVLPIGVSFYTFMTIAYTVDVYLGRFQPVDSLRTFALYVTFFPHLVAGPILRPSELLPQLRRQLTLTGENFRAGFPLILAGLMKKVVVADNLSGFVKQTFYGDLTYDTLTIFLGIAAFAVQIYCDFSGYSDIAIGSARIMGINFPNNFYYPYFARNVIEFWQRWHISLSNWLRDYLYFPLGGNRRNRSRQYLSLLATMLLAGLWHGAAWNFVLWGLYHGLLLVADRHLVSKLTFLNGRPWQPVKIAVTFYLVCLGWLIFIVPDISRLAFYAKKMLLLNLERPHPRNLLYSYPLPVLTMTVFFVAHVISYRTGGLVRVFERTRLPAWAAVPAGAACALVVITILYLFGAGQQQSFIYFRF